MMSILHYEYIFVVFLFFFLFSIKSDCEIDRFDLRSTLLIEKLLEMKSASGDLDGQCRPFQFEK